MAGGAAGGVADDFGGIADNTAGGGANQLLGLSHPKLEADALSKLASPAEEDCVGRIGVRVRVRVRVWVWVRVRCRVRVRRVKG